MDVSGLVQYNNIECGRISSIVFQKLFFFFFFFFSRRVMVYASISARLPPFLSRKDTRIGALATREANGSVKRVLEKQARQQSAKKRKRYTNFSDTDMAEIGQYAAIIVTTRLLVKLREGLRQVLLIREDKIANYLNQPTRKGQNRKGFSHAKRNSITVSQILPRAMASYTTLKML